MTSGIDKIYEHLDDGEAKVFVAWEDVAYIVWTKEKGKRLRLKRTEKKIKISDLLRQLEAKGEPSTRQTITALELGKRQFVSPGILVDICAEIGANIRDFLDIKVEI